MMRSALPAATLTVTVSERLLEQVPGYVLGLIAVPDIEVTSAEPVVEALLADAEDEIHRESLNRADVSSLPAIAAWRDAYRLVGVSPSRFPCAAESLLRRVAGGGRLPRINSLVDLCNGVSLASRLPVASCDTGDLDGELSVRLADGDEVYLPLGAPDRPERPEPGEVIYADHRGRAHSRRWNWRQSDVVKTDRGHRRLLITVEAVHEGGSAEVQAVLGRIEDVLDGLTTARQAPVVLDGTTRSGVVFAAEPSQTVR